MVTSKNSQKPRNVCPVATRFGRKVQIFYHPVCVAPCGFGMISCFFFRWFGEYTSPPVILCVPDGNKEMRKIVHPVACLIKPTLAKVVNQDIIMFMRCIFWNIRNEPKWRNWQTRQVQVLVGIIPGGGSSPLFGIFQSVETT